MKLTIHTKGIVGSAVRREDEESRAMINCVIEIDGHMIEDVTRVRVLHSADEFSTVLVRLIPGEVETIAHTAESWAEQVAARLGR